MNAAANAIIRQLFFGAWSLCRVACRLSLVANRLRTFRYISEPTTTTLESQHSMDSDALRLPMTSRPASAAPAVQRFCRQCLQAEPLPDFPGPELLRQDDVQEYLYTQLFAPNPNDEESPLTPAYSLRVLKALVSKIEESIDDWDEHVRLPNTTLRNTTVALANKNPRLLGRIGQPDGVSGQLSSYRITSNSTV